MGGRPEAESLIGFGVAMKRWAYRQDRLQRLAGIPLEVIMVDAQVLAAQQWLNQTYTGVSGYVPCAEDGSTGNQTVGCIIMGLQHEMGISPVVANLGPTTWADMQSYALNIAANYLNTPSISLVDYIKRVFASGGSWGDRYSQFFINRFGGSSAHMQACAEQVFLIPGDTAARLGFITARDALLFHYDSGTFVSDYTSEQLAGLGDAFANVITNHMS